MIKKNLSKEKLIVQNLGQEKTSKTLKKILWGKLKAINKKAHIPDGMTRG